MAETANRVTNRTVTASSNSSNPLVQTEVSGGQLLDWDAVDTGSLERSSYLYRVTAGSFVLRTVLTIAGEADALAFDGNEILRHEQAASVYLELTTKIAPLQSAIGS